MRVPRTRLRRGCPKREAGSKEFSLRFGLGPETQENSFDLPLDRPAARARIVIGHAGTMWPSENEGRNTKRANRDEAQRLEAAPRMALPFARPEGLAIRKATAKASDRKAVAHTPMSGRRNVEPKPRACEVGELVTLGREVLRTVATEKRDAPESAPLLGIIGLENSFRCAPRSLLDLHRGEGRVSDLAE